MTIRFWQHDEIHDTLQSLKTLYKKGQQCYLDNSYWVVPITAEKLLSFEGNGEDLYHEVLWEYGFPCCGWLKSVWWLNIEEIESELRARGDVISMIKEQMNKHILSDSANFSLFVSDLAQDYIKTYPKSSPNVSSGVSYRMYQISDFQTLGDFLSEPTGVALDELFGEFESLCQLHNKHVDGLPTVRSIFAYLIGQKMIKESFRKLVPSLVQSHQQELEKTLNSKFDIMRYSIDRVNISMKPLDVNIITHELFTYPPLASYFQIELPFSILEQLNTKTFQELSIL